MSSNNPKKKTGALIGLVKFQPVLLPPFVLSSAVHVAPPVAVLSVIDKNWRETDPLALESVNLLPTVVDFRLIKFDAVPDTVKVVTVCVVPAVKRIEWATLPSSLKSANVFDPEIVRLAVLAPLETQRLL